MRVAISWSGGKDSCLSCHRAMSSGMDVSNLVNFISQDERCAFHGVDSRLMIAQSQLLGIPLIQRKVTWDTYEGEFKAVMGELKRMGVEGAVFGDIDIEEHKDWVNRACKDVGIAAIEPLWRDEPELILTEFMQRGFEAIVVNAKADLFEENWLGRRIDQSFVKDLQELQNIHKIHLCGEFGEYHTLVTDGPIFKGRIRILDSRKVLKKGYWNHWFLDISSYAIDEKVRRGNGE